MRLIIIPTLLVFFFATVTFSAEPSLTDKEAKAFLEKLWSTAGVLIKLGSISVVASETNIAKNRISEENYKMYQAFGKLGIIRISIVKEYLDEKSDVNDFIAAAAGSMRKEIFVEKTNAGETLAKRGGLQQKDGWLVIKAGIYRVDEIVKNEARQKGVDNYRIIMATYTAKWTPEFKDAMEMTGLKLSEKRKMAMLIKFDPFSSTWKNVAIDLANREEDFSTNNVSRALGQYN